MTTTTPIWIRITLSSLLIGCGRNIPYEGGGSTEQEDTAPVVVEECGSDLDLKSGINITGTAIDLATGAPLAVADTGDSPLCVAAIDPTPAVTSGEAPTTLAASTLCDDGTYILSGIAEIPPIGVMVQIDDCNDEGTVMRSVTGVGADMFKGAAAGFTLEDITARSMSATTRDEMNSELTGYGMKFDLATDGFLAGDSFDSAMAPVSGATVTCGACKNNPTYYQVGTTAGAMFGDGSTPATTTNADGGSFFIVPAAPINTYTCDDGSHTWDGTLLGSLPGYGVFIRFIAQ